MKYNVGDRVRIKSLDWYNENKSKRGNISFPYEAEVVFTSEMSSFCGQIVTISQKGYTQDVGFYRIREDNNVHMWTDEMIEGLVEEENKPKPKFKVGDRVITNKGYIGKFEGWVSDYQVRVLFEESGCNVVIHPKDLKLAEEETKPNVIEEAKTYWDSIKDAWICPEGYIFKDENGNVINATKIVLEKKKKEYPKTYEECCRVLGVSEFEYNHTGTKVWYRHKLMATLDKLMLCRDAYWKIAGEEMGLGKPWEPDWSDDNAKYSIYTIKGALTKAISCYDGAIFTFSTEEMRDEFYENFKEEIESCKELL